jgi:hypothetical protein
MEPDCIVCNAFISALAGLCWVNHNQLGKREWQGSFSPFWLVRCSLALGSKNTQLQRLLPRLPALSGQTHQPA